MPDECGREEPAVLKEDTTESEKERMAESVDNGAANKTKGFFEGVEKLLEIRFVASRDHQSNLRDINLGQLKELLEIVRCDIVSHLYNNEMDAYILSESSMFVFKRKLILKTCGTTTPLNCLALLLKFARMYGFNDVENLFYSRKSYKKPELQDLPHKTFDQEIHLLTTVLRKEYPSIPDGRLYNFGDEHDRWYLYALRCNLPLRNPSEPDQTLEILMTELDPNVMSIFTKNVCSTSGEATEKSGIDKIIPEMDINDFLFSPCGYSMNGMYKGNYMTIHITPEPEFSYVSFECNVSTMSYDVIIRRVLATFKPRKFLVTIFANKQSAVADYPRDFWKQLHNTKSKINGWKRTELQYHNFPSFDFMCVFYSCLPS